MTLTAAELKLWHKMWFPDFDGGHFENGPKQLVHPNFFWWHRLLISGEVQGAKKTWSQTVLGGGVHGNSIWPMDYWMYIWTTMPKGSYPLTLQVSRYFLCTADNVPLPVVWGVGWAIVVRGGYSFSVSGGGFKIWQKKYYTVKGLMQSKAYWALFLTQYITKS